MLIIFFPLAYYFFPLKTSTSLSLVLVGLFMAIAYFLWRNFVTGRTEWTINESDVSMKWIKQFGFTKKSDLSIRWTEIKNISPGLDPLYDTLKIKLASGEKIKFYHDTLTTGDDYKEFEKVLYQFFNEKIVVKNLLQLKNNNR